MTPSPRRSTPRIVRGGTILAAASAVGLVLTGCAGGSVTGNSGEAGGATEILVWTHYTGDAGKTVEQIAADYNESQSEYAVRIQYGGTGDQFTPKLLNAVKNEQGPNLVLGDGTPQKLSQVVETGKVLPLEELLESPDSEITTDNFTEGMLSTGIVDGTIYSLPSDGGDYGLIYNKAMFEEAGITEPPATWEEVAQDATTLTKDGKYGIYLPIGTGEWPVFTWQSMLWGAGGEFLNEDNTEVAFNTPEGVEALTVWTDLVKNGQAYPQSLATGSDNQGMAAFSTGKVAMIITGAYNLGLLSDGVGEENVGVAPFPVLTEPAMNIGTNNSYLLDGTEEQEAGAWDFLQYTLSPEVQAEWGIATGYLPTNKETTETETYQAYLEENPHIEVFVKQLEYAKARPSILAYDEISSALAAEIEKALLGKVTPQQALETAAQNGQKALDG
jgi:multiple sugar transport system substrate-binding protein